MIKLFLITMFLAQGVFANNIELKINGEQYYCSKDPSNSGNSGDTNRCIEAGCKANPYNCKEYFSTITSACK